MSRSIVLAFLGSVLFCCAFISCTVSAALTPPDESSSVLKASDLATSTNRAELGEVLVSARRIPGKSVNIREWPGNATVITEKQINESNTATVPDLLEQYEGISMMDFSGFGLGADATVNLRGVVNSSRSGALVLVNGIRQNGLASDEIHWRSIPLRHIERIEILRGGSGIIYGEGAFSGVINIITKKGTDKPISVEQSVELGNYGQEKYFVSARGTTGPFSYASMYERSDLTGYRESTNSRATVITNHFGYEFSEDIHIETNILHSEDTTYFSGGITPAASQARRRQAGSFPGFSDDQTTQASLQLTGQGPYGFSMGIDAFWRFRETDTVTSFGNFASISPSRGLSLRGAHELELENFEHHFVTGIDLIDQKVSTGTRGSTFSESNKTGYGLFMEETIRLFNRASLVTGVRFDKSHFQEDITFPAFIGTLKFEGWSPKVGISLDVAEPLTVYANIARPFKAPNVFDFSVAIDFGFIGNTNLKPQQGTEYEVGIRLNDSHLGALGAHWFYSKVNDEILFNSLTFRSENFDTTRSGVELTVKPAMPIPQLTSLLTYTFLEAEFGKGPYKNKSLPGVPEHQATLHLTYKPIPKLQCSLDWMIVHDFFRINDFTNSLPGDNYGVLNLGLRYQVKPNATLHFRVENATNEEYTSFQSSNGVTVSTGENPAPQTVFAAGLTLEF